MENMKVSIDTLSLVLLGISVVLFAVHLQFLKLPSPLSHPILLGRQADSSPVRNANESGTWINSQAVGRGLVARPSNSARTVDQLVVEPSWRNRASGLAAGLIALLPNDSASTTPVAVIAFSDPSCQSLLPRIYQFP